MGEKTYPIARDIIRSPIFVIASICVCIIFLLPDGFTCLFPLISDLQRSAAE